MFVFQDRSTKLSDILSYFRINTALSCLSLDTLDIFAGAGIDSNQLTFLNKRRDI